MKQKSNELAKLERNRFSLFTDDLEHCIICEKKAVNKHEVCFGRNRQNSMKYGLVIPLCYQHHLVAHRDSTFIAIWHVKGQEKFEEFYPDLDFLSIFGCNYK